MSDALLELFALVDARERTDRTFAETVQNWRVAVAIEEYQLACALQTGLPCDRCHAHPHEVLSLCAQCVTPYVQERVRHRLRLLVLEAANRQEML